MLSLIECKGPPVEIVLGKGFAELYLARGP